jgi:hypothetical protein
MKRKKKILVCFISLISIFTFGQKKDLILDKESFLLGTLNDYMGRRVSQDDEDKIDNYGSFEKSLVLKIDSLFTSNFDDLLIKKTEPVQVFEYEYKINSKKLAAKINSNYTYKKYSWSQKKDTTFYGKLKENVFDNELKKISFIIGAYSRFGEQKDKRYSLRFVNSLSKFAECEKILKELGCKKVEIKIIKAIPTTQLIFFKPSRKLELYFGKHKYLNKQIIESRDDIIKELNERHNK